MSETLVIHCPDMRPVNSRNLVATRSGILICCAYVPPPQAMSRDAERFQAALLALNKRFPVCAEGEPPF